MTKGRLAPTAALIMAAGLAIGCGEPPKNGAAANTNAAPAAPQGNAPASAPQPKIVSDTEGPDGSRIKVRQGNGGNVTVRTWATGPISKVAKAERNGQVKAIRVVYRNGKIVRVEDKDAIAHALDWTAAQIDEVAQKSGKIVEDVPARGQAGDDDDEK
jgi:hypothetical protein